MILLLWELNDKHIENSGEEDKYFLYFVLSIAGFTLFFTARALILLCIVILCWCAISLQILFCQTNRISLNFHKQMVWGVLRAPTAFFDSNPVGRIITRFTKDTEIIDKTIFMSIILSDLVFL